MIASNHAIFRRTHKVCDSGSGRLRFVVKKYRHKRHLNLLYMMDLLQGKRIACSGVMAVAL